MKSKKRIRPIRLATVFSGIGAVEFALRRMGIASDIVFACDNGEIEIEYDREKEWTEIFDGVKDVIDVCAFQDGHVDFNELDAFLDVNARLCRKAGIRCWSNVESFDRDMPIRFLPIKFDKMRMKLESAARVGLEKGITFEFSHFMSPQSAYQAAGNLYRRYRECMGV